jgi:hypothetical protein
MSTNTQRIVIFVLAGILDFVVSLMQGFGATDWFLWFIVAGIQGVIIYEIMSRTQPFVRLITLPIYGAIYLILRSFTGNIVWSIMYNSSNFEYLGEFSTYSWGFTAPYSLSIAGIVVLVLYFLLSGSVISIPGIGNVGGQSTASDKVMLEVSDDLVTRLMCASAITQGALFRRKVLSRIENQYTAVAPEFGLDLELLVGVCQFLERRETKFQTAFFVVGLVGMLLSATPIGILAMVILTAPIMFIKIYNEKYDLLKNFTSNEYDREKVRNRFSIEQKNSIVNGLPKSDQNLVVYGGFSPFVGAGFDLGGWSFALDVSRPKSLMEKDETVNDFEVSELYKEIEAMCKGLNLPNLSVADLCYASGQDIRNDRIILPNPVGKPVQHIDNNYLKSADDFRVRQYKHISVSAWGNDVVFSIFMRCVIKGKNLFVEVARYLLPPVSNQYRKHAESTNKSFSAIAGITLSSLVLGPINGYFAWLILLGKFINFISQTLELQDRKLRNEIKKNSNFNYGVASSLREDVSGTSYLHYFQKFDREMYVKILDNEILETLLSFLDDHNIDTSQLRERQTTILNNGIFVQGGNVKGESIAAGQGAKAITNSKKSSSRKE